MNIDITNASRVRLWIVLGILIVLAGIFIGKPFTREQDQMRALRVIGEDEQKTDEAVAGVREYVSEEKILKDIDRSLMDFQSEVVAP
jgi:hypothetical protein